MKNPSHVKKPFVKNPSLSFLAPSPVREGPEKVRAGN